MGGRRVCMKKGLWNGPSPVYLGGLTRLTNILFELGRTKATAGDAARRLTSRTK